MKKILKNYQIASKGLNTDLLPWDLPMEFVTNLSNIRIVDNKLTPFGGSNKWADLPVDFVPGFLMASGSLSTKFWLIAGADAVYAFDGSTFFDISSAVGYAGINNEDLWQGCLLANIPIINNEGIHPEYWPQQSGGIPLEPLPWDATNTWDDVNESAKIIRSHRQFLFALDLQSGGEEIGDGVRWSAPADIGGLPPTWDPFDTTNVAGITNLGGAGGRIIDGRSMRDAFVVYRENGVSVFDFAGGQFVWKVRHLTDTGGLISPDSLVEVKGRHYYMGDGDVIVNDGNTVKSILHSRIRKRFLASFSAETYLNSYAVKSNVNSEVWFCVPEAGEDYPSIAYIYNWRDDSWSIRDLPQAPFANYGPHTVAPRTWDTVEGDWESIGGYWSQTSISPLDDTIISATKPEGIGQSGSLLRLDKTLDALDSPFSSTIERVSISFDDLLETEGHTDNVTTITRVYPHIKGPGSVQIKFGTQMHSGDAIKWGPEVTFDPNKDRKLDLRSTGELHSYRISTTDTTAAWELSGMEFEIAPVGKR